MNCYGNQKMIKIQMDLISLDMLRFQVHANYFHNVFYTAQQSGLSTTL